MDKADRKAAIAAWKERPPELGVFVVRCATTGACWVGKSRALGAQRNGLWFALGHGSHPNRALQAEWTQAGADVFSFEILERLPADTPAYAVARLLKERTGAWCATLSARPL